jgi:transcriptional regulator with XRE-family HTH domain
MGGRGSWARIGREIRRRRVGKWTLRQFAGHLRISPAQLSRIEGGKRNPRNFLDRAAQYLRVPRYDLEGPRRRSLGRHTRLRRSGRGDSQQVQELEREIAALVPRTPLERDDQHPALVPSGYRYDEDPELSSALTLVLTAIRTAVAKRYRVPQLNKTGIETDSARVHDQREFLEALARAAALDPTLLYRHPLWRAQLEEARKFGSPFLLRLLGRYAGDIRGPLRISPPRKRRPRGRVATKGK